ncbi:hypothetical protein AK830_g3385 [Neonectria ditissima]|uniref:Zn(2)-C6 fungal-type domain-containing protein n=1 Tax=Neonectria ditissima TaxID=78410 RepID=A0A0P7BRU8_9HYPO|nr:hypothetical protein AK830_g3385 [Neonectria ditissima]
MPSPPPMSKRRLACERCRTQKLKCNRRSEAASEPCPRCVQAQEECIIGPRKTPGRPAGRANNHDHDRSPEASEPLETQFDPSATSIAAFEDAFDSPFDFPLDNNIDPAGFLSSMNDYDFPESMLNNLEPTADFSMPWDAPLDESSHCQPFHMLEQNADSGFRLSSLHQKLSKELFMLKSLPWDITSVMKLESGPCSNGCHRGTGKQGREFNPLITTFNIIAELEHVFNTFKNLPTSGAATGAPGLGQGMNVSHSLTAMSCYLLLIFIYDCIFTHVLDQASNNLLVRDFILHSAPSVSLGWFSIPTQTNLVGQLFVQLMQLKMKPIETALGLPGDCRVSSEGDEEKMSPTGLLGGKHRESLLAALKGSDIDGGSDLNAAGALDSLRDKMARLGAIK